MTAGFAAAAPATAHVFVDGIEGDDDLWVEGDDGHHLQRVRRLRAGESVTAGDGRGGWRLYVIAEVGEGRIRLTPSGPLTREPPLDPRLVVAFAPAKGDHAGTVAHQLVELGVDAIMPITLRRSVVRWDGERGDKARARMARVVREAAMQSRRATIPEVMHAPSLTELAAHPGLVVADPAGVAPGELRRPVGDEWLVLIGPEGGLDPTEREVLASAAQLAVGHHVLRAVTAPVAVAAALVGFRSTRPSDFSELPDIGRTA